MKHSQVLHCPRRPFPANLTVMRRVLFLLAVLCGASAPALAQVTVDLRALDALPGTSSPTPERSQPLPTLKRITTARPRKSPSEEAIATPPPPAPPPPNPAATQTPGQAAPPPATLPTAPPPVVALAPIVQPQPSTPAAPPPPPQISPTAASTAAPTGAGLRVTFGSGQSDLSPASATAIQNLVKAAPSGDSTTYNVIAYAAGTPEDPSTARRLSLSRALAVRGELMANGIGSSRIYVRALGAPSGDETPDRVDVSIMGGNAPASAQAGQPSVQR